MRAAISLSKMVRVIRTLLEMHEARPSIDDVAQLLGMSGLALRRSLRRQHLLAFRKVLKRSRLNHAARHLRMGLKIEAAVRLAGFRNRTNFNRLFRAHFGCLPREYQRRVMGRDPRERQP